MNITIEVHKNNIEVQMEGSSNRQNLYIGADEPIVALPTLWIKTTPEGVGLFLVTP